MYCIINSKINFHFKQQIYIVTSFDIIADVTFNAHSRNMLTRAYILHDRSPTQSQSHISDASSYFRTITSNIIYGNCHLPAHDTVRARIKPGVFKP